MSQQTSVKQLLIVSHAPSANTQTLTQAVLSGAKSQADSCVVARCLSPFEVGPQAVIDADALILGTPENFGYMSGALKDFFDRVYYPCLEHTVAKPYAVWVRAGHDGTGSTRAINSLCQGLQWRAVQEVLLCKGAYRPQFEKDCHDLGAALSAGLALGVF